MLRQIFFNKNNGNLDCGRGNLILEEDVVEFEII